MRAPPASVEQRPRAGVGDDHVADRLRVAGREHLGVDVLGVGLGQVAGVDVLADDVVEHPVLDAERVEALDGVARDLAERAVLAHLLLELLGLGGVGERVRARALELAAGADRRGRVEADLAGRAFAPAISSAATLPFLSSVKTVRPSA